MPRSAVIVPRFSVRDMVSCLNFDGVDDTVAITSVAAQNNLTTITIAGWVNPRSLGEGGGGRLFSKGTGLSGRWRLGMLATNTISFRTQCSGGANNWDAPNFSIPFGKWTHIALSVDLTSVSNSPVIYINGVSVAVNHSVTSAGTLNADDTEAYIGNDSTTARTFDGKLDDIQLYNKVLSQAEIENIYYRGITTTGLVGHWKLDEGSGTTATDATGNANGTITGATYSTDVFIKPRTAAGNITGKAGNFNGTSSKVSINSVAAQNSLSNMTLSLWVNIQGAGGGGFARAFHKGPNAVGYIDLQYSSSTSKIAFGRDGVTADLSYAFAAPSTSAWHHILITDDGTLNRSGTEVYVDGVFTAEDGSGSSGSGGLTADSSAMAIGNRTTDTARAWNGYIDEVRLYNRILSSTEIATLFAKGHIQSGLVGWWSFDQLYGNVTPDFSTSGANGVASNTSLVNGNIDYVRYELPTARTAA